MHNEIIIDLNGVEEGEFRFVKMGKNSDEEMLVYAYGDNDNRKYIAIAKMDKPLSITEQQSSVTRLKELMNPLKNIDTYPAQENEKPKLREYSEHNLKDMLQSPVGQFGKFTKEGYDFLNHKHFFSNGKLGRTVYVYIDPEKHNSYGSNDPSVKTMFKSFNDYDDMELTPFETNYTNLKSYYTYHFKKVIDFCKKDRKEKEQMKQVGDKPQKSTLYEMLMQFSQKNRRYAGIRNVADYKSQKEALVLQEKLVEEVLKVVDARYEKRLSEILAQKQKNEEPTTKEEINEETMTIGIK